MGECYCLCNRWHCMRCAPRTHFSISKGQLGIFEILVEVSLLSPYSVHSTTEGGEANPCIGDYTCVAQADNNWSQCIDCSDTSQFQTDCFSWTEAFKAAAEAACDLTCPN